MLQEGSQPPPDDPSVQGAAERAVAGAPLGNGSGENGETVFRGAEGGAGGVGDVLRPGDRGFMSRACSGAVGVDCCR